jgi:general secretion pathway protein A
MTAMYLDYFGLSEAPFSIAPSPHYLYMSPQHQEALAHLLYGIEGDGGFVLLTGEVGTGKTTVCRVLLEQLPETCDVAYIFNPKLSVEELLATLCLEFGIDLPEGNSSNKLFIDRLNAHLLDVHARGRHAVLIIDEAQNLSADVLEQMRLLTNLETSERKLLQIILIGQPELARLLDRPDLRQLAQRIIARYHLGPLSRVDVAAYIRHRLAVAGTERPLFPASVIAEAHRLSGGVPRLVNVLCDRALLGAYAEDKEQVDRATLTRAAHEIFGRPVPVWRRMAWAYATLAMLGVVGAIAWWQWRPPTKGVAMPVPVAKPSGSDAVLPQALSWPGAVPRDQAESLANAALLKAWGLAYRGPKLCPAAVAQGLLCRSGRIGLDELRRMDRPAVLLMSDPQGRSMAATLLRLGPASARFSIGGVESNVALAALATQWSGQYTLLWRLPQGVPENLRPGARGPGVRWLADQVAKLGHKPAVAGKDVFYDQALVRQVKQFQLDQGLVPVGYAGPQTLLRLLALTDATGPKLTGGAP